MANFCKKCGRQKGDTRYRADDSHFRLVDGGPLLCALEFVKDFGGSEREPADPGDIQRTKRNKAAWVAAQF